MSRTAPRTVRTPLLALASVAVACVLVAGCSSESDGGASKDTTKKTTTTTTAGIDTSTTRAAIDPGEIEGGEQAYVDAMILMIRGSAGLSDADAESAAECLAPRWVKIIGVDGFAKAGLTPDDFQELGGGLETLGLDRDQATAMAAGFKACDIDLRGYSIEQIAADPAVTPEMKACLEDAITEEAVEESLIANLIGEEGETDTSAAAQACFDPAG